ncbi:MAG: hypothetical protein AAF702_35950 [Chloroflexota bacterium]
MMNHLADCIVNERETALANIAATIELIISHYQKLGQLNIEEISELQKHHSKMSRSSSTLLPHAIYLELIHNRGLTSVEFQILMVNTILRVALTYFEIPLNVASAALHGNLRSYGIITNNASDEAGHGVPENTHPALLNQTSAIFSGIFRVNPITFKTALAALALKANEESWKLPVSNQIDRKRAAHITQRHLEVDEYSRVRTKEEFNKQLEIAIEYSKLIPQPTLEFYKERLQNLTEAIALQNQFLDDPENARLCDLKLAAQLAVREAAASDPQGFIEIFNREVVDRYLGYVEDNMQDITQARMWGDIHVDSEMGILYGYEGHSAEDDHAEQALAVLVERIRGPKDLLLVMQTMNRLTEFRMALWAGTVEEMNKRVIPEKAIPPKRLYEEVVQCAKHTMMSSYGVAKHAQSSTGVAQAV